MVTRAHAATGAVGEPAVRRPALAGGAADRGELPEQHARLSAAPLTRPFAFSTHSESALPGDFLWARGRCTALFRRVWDRAAMIMSHHALGWLADTLGWLADAFGAGQT
jgi:hypothetical protein